MKIGVSIQNTAEARRSGKAAAQTAVAEGRIDRPDLALAFCSGAMDAEGFVAGLRSVLGNGAPIVGGSAIGVMDRHRLTYADRSAGVMVLQSDAMRCRVAAAGEVDRDERRAGFEMASRLPPDPEERLLLVFYDSIKRPAEGGPPALNASPPLIEGIEAALGRTMPVIGAGLIGDYGFHATRQFTGANVAERHLVGVQLCGDVTPYFRIIHGLTPLDGVYHTITRMDGGVIHEIDGKPIVRIIDELYGDTEWRHQNPLKRLAIGVNMGEKYAPFREDHYVNRLITGVLPGGDGIMMFEPDLEEGMAIQFMIRDGTRMVRSAKRNARRMMDQVIAEGRRPAFGLYIDCAGRTAAHSDTLTEEAEEVMAIFRYHDTPFFGFYTGVEIAPLLGKNRGLDWTRVLLVIAEY